MEGLLYRIINFLGHPRLPYWLALVSILLTSPSLWIGFHLDDHVGRYLMSGLSDPDAKQLLEAYGSPYGIANGDPSSIHWQIEKGFAPFWTYERLLISLWRPLSEFIHDIDFIVAPNSAFEMHAHSLLWFAALIVVVTKLYRKLMGLTTLAGVAALLFAYDHTHGFAVGYIANRNAIVALFFGVLTIYFHDEWRTKGSKSSAFLSGLFLLCGLLSGESAIATYGYLVAYTVFLEKGALNRRLLTLAPSSAILCMWQISYSLLGYGARGSGLYIDPLRAPVQFAFAVLERLPLLLLGQYFLPPAEVYNYVHREVAIAIWIGALIFLIGFIAVALPLVLRNALARFWAFGMLFSLIPICTSHPNNRLLFFVGLGAMGLLSQLWHGLVDQESWRLSSPVWNKLANGLVAVLTGFHLFISPLLLPLTACGVLLLSPVNHALEKISGDLDLKGRDLIIVTSPDYFLVKLIPMVMAVEKRPKLRRLRAISFGPIPVDVTRIDARSLSVKYRGGILQTSLLELYRDADIPMQPGQVIELKGLRIEVTGVTADGRASRIRFTFDENVEAERFRWMKWGGTEYVAFRLPAVGATVHLPAATMHYGI